MNNNIDIAIEFNEIEVIKRYFIEERTPILTIKHIRKACKYGNVEMVKLFIESGFKVNAGLEKRTNYTALHIASSCNNMDLAKLLIAKGADINKKVGFESSCPLRVAIYSGSPDVVKLLIENKAKIMKHSLSYAVQYNNLDVLKVLLQSGANVNEQNKSGRAPLYVLSSFGNCKIKVAEFLIENKANVNQLVEDSGESAIFEAVRGGRLDLVELLVEHNADINLTNKEGKTPLYYASEHGFIDIISFLLKKGATVHKSLLDVCSNDKEFRCECQEICGHIEEQTLSRFRKRLEIIKILVDAGADINYYDENNRSLIYFGVSGGDIELVKWCLQLDKVNIDNPDVDGKTPLCNVVNLLKDDKYIKYQRTISKNYMKVIKLLILNGVSTDTIDYPPVSFVKKRLMIKKLYTQLILFRQTDCLLSEDYLPLDMFRLILRECKINVLMLKF